MQAQKDPRESIIGESLEIEAQTPMLSKVLVEVAFVFYEEQDDKLNHLKESTQRNQLVESNKGTLKQRIESAKRSSQIEFTDNDKATINTLEEWLFVLEDLEQVDQKVIEQELFLRIVTFCRENSGLAKRLYKNKFQNAYIEILKNIVKTYYSGNREEFNHSLIYSSDPNEIVRLCRENNLLIDPYTLLYIAKLIRPVNEVFENSPELYTEKNKLCSFICLLFSDAQQGLIEMPDQKDITQLSVLILENLKNGNYTRVLSPICPDYFYKVDPETGQNIFTMEGVGGGIGLVGQTILNTGTPILKSLGCITPVRWKPGYAGLESTETNLISNNVPGNTHTEREQYFLNLLNQSARKLEEDIRGKWGYNIMVGIYPNDAIFSEEESIITLKDFNKLRELFSQIGEFTMTRQSMGEMQNVSTGIDWIIMGLIASSNRCLIVDGASSAMGKKFYGIARSLCNILSTIPPRTDGSSYSELELLHVAKALEINRKDIDYEKTNKLVYAIQSIIGTNIGTQFPVIYLRTNYAGY